MDDPAQALRNAVTSISAANAALAGDHLEHADKQLEGAEEAIHEVRGHVHDLKLERLEAGQ